MSAAQIAPSRLRELLAPAPGRWSRLRSVLASPGAALPSDPSAVEPLCEALESALSGPDPEHGTELIAAVECGEGAGLLSDRCRARLGESRGWVGGLLGLLEGEPEEVLAAADVLQGVVVWPDGCRVFEELGGLAVVSRHVKEAGKRRDVRHKLCELLHFYLLPEAGEGARAADQKAAMLSAHVGDERIVAGLRTAFDHILRDESGDLNRLGISASPEPAEEDVEIEGLARKIAADTLVRSPRRRARPEM